MLSAAGISKIKPKDKLYRLTDEKGLYLEVHPAGGMYWRLKYRFAGKEKRLAFGVYPEVTLKEAREKRSDARKLLTNGVDPGEAKRAQKLRQKTLADDSFKKIALEWYEKELPHWTASYGERVKRLIETDLAILATRPIAEINAPELLAALRRIEGRGAIDTAHGVKQKAGQIFRYAIATGRAERDPSRDLDGALARPVKKHLPAITDPDKVAILLNILDGYEGTPVVRAALKIAPMVFVRPGELRQMEWGELYIRHPIRIIAVDDANDSAHGSYTTLVAINFKLKSGRS